MENGMPVGFCSGDGEYFPGPDACESDADCVPSATGVACYTGTCSGNVCVTIDTACGTNQVCCRGVCKMDDAVSASAQALICPICSVNSDCCSGCCHYAPCWQPCSGDDDAFLPLDGNISGQNCYRADQPARIGHCHYADESFNGIFLCTDCVPTHGYCGGGAPCCEGSCVGGYCGGPYVGSENADEEEVVCKDFCEEGECGQIDSGCGGTIDCGPCDEVTTGAPECVPTSCDVVGCGGYADACDGNGAVYCGDCCTATDCATVGCGGYADACDGNGPQYCGDCPTTAAPLVPRGGDCTDTAQCEAGNVCRAGKCRRAR